jgi:dTDP-4-amino-4,6-dideoxygalactose transaminase
MAIPYGHQSIDDSDIDAVTAAMRDDWLTMGPTVARFEEAVAAAAGTSGSVSVTSGTAALHTAYAAMGLTAGDEVVVTPYTFVATAAAAALHGATIRFADIQEDTGNLDPDAVEAVMSERTAAVAAVDFAGHPIEADRLSAIAHEHGAMLVEDAAHAIGSTSRGRPVGSLADITTFSFFPTKNLTSTEGGAVVARDAAVLERARRFRSHGLVRDPADQRYPDEGPWHQEVHELGLNYRLPDVLCALGLSQIARLDAFKRRRAAVFQRYADGLAGVDGLVLPSHAPDVDPAWHLYAVRVRDGRRRELYDHLRANDVLVQVNYIPVYWHPYFEDLGFQRGLCPVAEQFYQEELSLPMYADLSESDQDRVIELVRGALV